MLFSPTSIQESQVAAVSQLASDVQPLPLNKLNICSHIQLYPFSFLATRTYPKDHSTSCQLLGVHSTLTYELHPLSGSSHHPSKELIFDPGSIMLHHSYVLSVHLALSTFLPAHQMPPSEQLVSYP
ncbi:hypothetical protein Tco_1480072 [Tanacetum coccineum]